MARQEDLQLIQHIARKLDENPVANFGYTGAAFDNDIIDGVDVFDKNMEQNIPKDNGYDPLVRDKGVRAQAGSIPRTGWNHYIGRLSYNVNKLVRKIKEFFAFLAEWMAHNAAEYDPTARYKTGDVCYTVSQERGVKVYAWYTRHSLYPETITAVPPAVGAHWEEMQSATSSSAILPFAAPGYRHKYAVADLTGPAYDRDAWYPVVTGFQDFTGGILDGKDDAVQVLIEAYCNGAVAGRENPCRADLVVAASFTGFAATSTDIVLRDVFADAVTGQTLEAEESPIGFSKLPKGRQAVLWLRGGGAYALWNSFGGVFELQEAAYDNGLDEPAAPGARVFEPVPETVRARLVTPGAALPEEAPNLGQVSGSLPLPKTLSAGAQLDSVRAPGLYVVTGAAAANSVRQLPVDNPGPFELTVTGDRDGAAVTVQRLMVRANGSEYTRVLAGNTVLVPWYLSSSPLGTAFFVPGLWMFDINEEGRLVLYYHDGDTPPDFMIDDDGHLLMEIA